MDIFKTADADVKQAAKKATDLSINVVRQLLPEHAHEMGWNNGFRIAEMYYSLYVALYFGKTKSVGRPLNDAEVAEVEATMKEQLPSLVEHVVKLKGTN